MDFSLNRTLTKKQLCYIFGLTSPSGKTLYYKKLRSEYFTEETLQIIGLSSIQYTNLKGGKPFTFAQTRAIIKLFDISPDELRLNFSPIAA